MTGGEIFYKTLPSVSRFSDCVRAESYQPAPSDWIVVVADIEGSTKAISEGRYKTVNMVGAAVITGLLNACPNHELPYVFGGDGATLLIPPSLRDAAERSLRLTRAWAHKSFDLTLRIGLAPLEDLAKQGAEVRVAKYEMSPGNELAMFTGHGVELADRLIKAEGSPYRLEDAPIVGDPDLEGLSCRWAPLNSRRGQMLTLLVHAHPDLDPAGERRLYSDVVDRLAEILGDGGGAPVTLENLKYHWPPKGIWREVKTAPRGKRLKKFLGVTFVSLIVWCLNRTNKSLGGFDPARYRNEFCAQSDFRKFDDMLRMVLDCSVEEAAEIEAFLEKEDRAARLCYGLHRSDRALITCLVFSVEDNRHIHFIDGAGGGYAQAAVQLKDQLVAASRTG